MPGGERVRIVDREGILSLLFFWNSFLAILSHERLVTNAFLFYST